MCSVSKPSDPDPFAPFCGGYLSHTGGSALKRDGLSIICTICGRVYAVFHSIEEMVDGVLLHRRWERWQHQEFLGEVQSMHNKRIAEPKKRLDP